VTPRRTRPFTSHARSGLAPSHCATSTWGPFVNPSFCRAAKPASTDLRALIVSRVELWIFPIPSPRALALASLVRSTAPVFGPAWAIKLCTGPLLHRFYSPRPGLPTSAAIRTVRERESLPVNRELCQERRLLDLRSSGAGYWTSPVEPWRASVTNVVN
jgi:hypothetical protein